jgi:hypothetical protein
MDESSYLWDKTGAPEPDIAQWEKLLGRFGADRPPAWRGNHPRRVWVWALAAAACVVLGFGALVAAKWKPGAKWRVDTVAGSPKIDATPIGSGGTLSVGQVLKTDAAARARVHLGLMGVMTVEPDTRLKLVETRPGRYTLTLDKGKISASLWAPPFSLFVTTPSSTAIDLGCAYTLEVDERGYGILQVTSGWVALELDERQTLVPAGASAITHPETGPGTPFFSDASVGFKTALEELDFGTRGYRNPEVLQTLLTEARGHDVMTLLQVLDRLDLAERGRVFDRAAQLLPPPPGLLRENVVRGEAQAGVDEWRRKLNLGDVKKWLVHWRDVLPALR